MAVHFRRKVYLSGRNKSRQFFVWILPACFVILLISGCADLEAPVREFSAEKWSDYMVPQLDFDWEFTPPGAIEVLIVERGSGKGTFGHTAIHVGRFAYSWDYGGGYVLVRQSFRSFLHYYTHKYNRSVKGITIEFPDDAIKLLVRDLDKEFQRAWNEGYKRSSFFLISNCSTIVYHELLDASGRKPKGWPPILLPSWMGKNVQRTFPLLYYTIYERAVP